MSKLSRWTKSILPHSKKKQKSTTSETTTTTTTNHTLRNSSSSCQNEPIYGWKSHYDELCLFRHRYGHVNVPKSYTEISGLADWVETQRIQYQRRHTTTSDQSSSVIITPEQIRDLERLGFVWITVVEDDETRDDGGTELSSLDIVDKDEHEGLWNKMDMQRETPRVWSQKVRQLKSYKERFGHVDVSKEDDFELNRWLQIQRQHLEWMSDGKWSKLSTRRMQELMDLGVGEVVHDCDKENDWSLESARRSRPEQPIVSSVPNQISSMLCPDHACCTTKSSSMATSSKAQQQQQRLSPRRLNSPTA